MTVVSAHDLTQTRLCSTPGCPYDADQDSEMCSSCTSRAALYDGRGARDGAPRRLARTVAVVPEAQRKTCRWEGCDERSTGMYDRGVLANLCAAHEEDARDQAARASTERWRRRRSEGGTVPLVALPDPPDEAEKVQPELLVERARAVLAAAERLEGAYRDLASARETVEEAEAIYRDAVGGLLLA